MDQVLKAIKEIEKESPESWSNVPNDKKQALSQEATNRHSRWSAEKFWRIADAEDRQEFMKDQKWAKVLVKQGLINSGRLCGLVEIHLADHLKQNGGGNLMRIIRFHATYNTEAASKISNPPAPVFASPNALSDETSCKSRWVRDGDTLNASQIHYNMFWGAENESDCLTFIRFVFPQENLITTLGLTAWADQIEELAKDLDDIRTFLGCLSSCDEALTQAVFMVYLSELLAKLNGETKPEEKLSVLPVNGMKAVKVDAVVRQVYMKRVATKTKKSVTDEVTEKRVNLVMKSDLVVWNGVVPENSSNAEEQTSLFLNCNINIEMKPFNILKGEQNRDPLTQCAAESMARKKVLLERCPSILYGIVTDISGLYVLWHQVHDKNLDKYWVSRKVSDTVQFVTILYWLCLNSIEDKSVVKLNEKWKDSMADGGSQEEGNDKHGSAGGSGDDEGTPPSTLHSINEETRGNNNDVDEEDSGGDEVMVIDFDDICDSDDDEEHGADPWSTFYAIENQRLLGMNLPLTRNLLKQHTESLEGMQAPPPQPFRRFPLSETKR